MTAPTPRAVDHAAFVAGFRKLAAAFPGSFADEGATEDKMRLWRELLDAHPWVTQVVFAAGVLQIAWRHQGDFLPGPALALDYFQAASDELDRENRRRLPRPAPPTDDERLEADARSAAAKGAARAKLPPKMRAVSPKRRESAR